MPGWARIILSLSWRLGALLALVIAALVFANRPQGWDGRAHLAKQDGAIIGKAGVVIVTLAQPSRYDPVFYVNFLEKLYANAIPWPINVIVRQDRGVALIDPDQPYATAMGKPRRLVDVAGSERDIDGTPWVEKLGKDIVWIAPSKTTAFDIGYYLYRGRKGGMATTTAKTLLRMRWLYYARLPDGYMPHGDETNRMAQGAIDAVTAATGAPGVVADGFHPNAMKKAVHRLLAQGVDTIVLGSTLPVQSDFEELRGTYPKVVKIVEEWRAKNGAKPIKIIIASSPASQSAYRDLYVSLLTQTLAPAPRTDAKATIILAYHGLPPALMARDSWAINHKTVSASLEAPLKTAAAALGWRDVKIVTAYEAFSQGAEDKKNAQLSVNEAVQKAVREKQDHVVALPLEFLSENSDSLFGHAALVFEGLPGYAPFDGPPSNIDWSTPYRRQFKLGATTFTYAGAPAGAPMDSLETRALEQSILATLRPSP
jgi:protoheme ferro-lyase